MDAPGSKLCPNIASIKTTHHPGRSLRADARRRITLYYQSQVSLQGTGSEPLGLGPSSAVENGNSLASLGSKGKNRNSLACLRNDRSHSAVTYCRDLQVSFGSEHGKPVNLGCETHAVVHPLEFANPLLEP